MLTSYNGFGGSNTVVVGRVNTGEVGEVGYSLQFSPFHKEVDESFDIMIKYGDNDTYDFIREGYVKNGSSFWNEVYGNGILGWLLCQAVVWRVIVVLEVMMY